MVSGQRTDATEDLTCVLFPDSVFWSRNTATALHHDHMPFVKLDTQILDSTLWLERECRDIFITSLLMAEPREFSEAQKQIEIDSLAYTGFEVPPGWYGFVPAASSGISRRAMVELPAGLAALAKLGAPEETSRSKDFDGRRMIRVDGGFLILNYMKYRDRDYTATERSRRFRERRKNGVAPLGNGVASRQATQAEAEAEAESISAASGSSIVDAVRKRFPRADLKMCDRLAASCRAKFAGVADDEIALAVLRTNDTHPDQNSPGLYLTTVIEELPRVLHFSRKAG